MSHNEDALASELVARHGVTTTTRLARLGIGRRAVDGLVRNKRLRRAGTGVTHTIEDLWRAWRIAAAG